MRRIKYKAKVTPNPHPARAVADGKVSGHGSQHQAGGHSGEALGSGVPLPPSPPMLGRTDPRHLRNRTSVLKSPPSGRLGCGGGPLVRTCWSTGNILLCSTGSFSLSSVAWGVRVPILG